MPNEFIHGYALLVGVGESAYSKWSLPVTVKDIQALRSILADVNLCGYPDDKGHIRLLHDAGATRSAILDGLAWLKAQAVVDPEATVVVYYSGHGWLDRSTGQYYLLPHDVEGFDIPGSALSAQAFTDALHQIAARRLLVFVDSCHAEGMATAKDKPVVNLPPGFVQAALPKGLANDLKRGEGRVVFTSSRGEQRSWVRPDATLSIYTYHLLEALQGAGNQPGDTLVRVSNLMNHLGKAVPESARRLCRAEQVPFFDAAAEDFPIAVLRGGKSLPAGGWDTVQHEAADTIRNICQIMLRGSGAIAQGSGAVAAEGRGVAVGGDMIHNKVEGDQVRGDQIIVGDISGSIVPIGRGSQVAVVQVLAGDEMTGLFAVVYQQIKARPEDPDVDKEELTQTVQKIEEEVTRGNQANPNRVGRWLKTLALMAPDILDVTVACLTSPVAGIAAVIRKVARTAGEGTESV